MTSCNDTPITQQTESDMITDSSADTASLYEPGSCDVEPWSEEKCAQVAASINNRFGGTVKKIASDFVYAFEPEANAPNGYYYNMVPVITNIDGTFYMMWASGKQHEYDKGQRVVYAFSDDGLNWSSPITLFDPETFTDPDVCFGPCGFSYIDGKIYAYARAHTVLSEPTGHETPSKIKLEASYVRTSVDGINWTGMKMLSSTDTYQSKPLRSGRLMTYSTDHPSKVNYTDKINALTGLGTGWATAEFNVSKAVNSGAKSLIERDFYQDDDGVVYMFFRSLNTSDCKQWVCFSFDEGETWSDIYPTNFSDACSQFAYGRLPDGRYYCVSNTIYSADWARNPLVLSVSEDGINFSTQYILRNEKDYVMKEFGWQKKGDFAYPSVVIVGDYMYIAHAVKNETIAITRVALSDI